MGLFGPPNIDKLKSAGNIRGLVQALTHRDQQISTSALQALADLNWSPDPKVTTSILSTALQQGHDHLVTSLINHGVVLDAEHDPDCLRSVLMLHLGLDPWYHKDTPERMKLIKTVQTAIKPDHNTLTDYLITMLATAEFTADRGLAALVLGILYADTQLMSAHELSDHTVLTYNRSVGNQIIELTLSLNCLASAGSAQSKKPEVIAALQGALSDQDNIPLEPGMNSYPSLDIHISMLISVSQQLTLARQLHPWEIDTPTYITSYQVSEAAALALILIGDKDSDTALVDLGVFTKSTYSAYGKAAMFKLAHDLGFSGIVTGLSDLACNHSDSHIRGWACDCLRAIGADAVEALIVVLKDSYWATRRVAATALGEIGDPQAREALIAAGEDKDGGVRKAAAWAVHQLS